jgi:acyl-CoA synthetase (AMP-forming)/AMP-acid ligase II
MFWKAALKAPKATWYSAVPTMHATILAQAEEEAKKGKMPHHTLTLIRNCSAALVPTVAERMESLFKASIMPTYAMTESMPITSNPRYGIRKTRSVGPRGGPELQIMKGHPDNTVLSAGSEGEVCVKYGPVTHGYEFRDHMDCDPNIEAFGDGWLRTGDKGWMDKDGYLYLSGRFKEIINRGGEKISPFEIEDVMRKHEAIQDVIAFAAPHEDLGEVVGVAVVKRPGMDTNVKELRQWAMSGGLLQVRWLPECAVFLHQIPKGPTGKPARIGLAKRLQMNRSTARHSISSTQKVSELRGE